MEYSSRLETWLGKIPIKYQVLYLSLTIGLVILPAIAASVFYVSLSKIEDVVEAKGSQKVELVSILSIDALITKDRPALETLITGLRSQEPGLDSILITDSEDQEIVSWSRPDPANKQKRQLSTEQPIMFAGQEFGSLLIKWDYQYFSTPIIKRLLKNTFIVLLITLGLLSAMMIWFQYWFIRPLECLDEKVRSIAIHSKTREAKRIVPSLEFKNLNSNLDLTKEILAERAENEAKVILAKAQTNAANELADARMKFLSLMSHEIRTPLGVMIGFSQLLKSANLNSEEREYLNNIHQSGGFLVRIIDDILDLSKIEANGIKLEPLPLSLERIGDDVQTMLQKQADQKGLFMKVEVEGSGPNALVGDSHRLKQILINLVGNAIKFTSEGGVTIKISQQDNSDSRMNVRFEVSDTGVGMSAEQLTTIFNPFSQADCSTTRKFGGTGLGLFISQQLVELMGGTIEVSSEVGKGAQFSFAIEMAKSDILLNDLTTSDDDFLEKPSTKSGLSILIAEDELPNRILIEKFLSKSEHSIQFACDGEECINLIESGQRFDVVFLDLHMPKFGGLEIAKNIREGVYGHSIQQSNLAIMSADVLAIDEVALLGIDTFISKPVSFDALNQFLSNVQSDCAPENDERNTGKDEELDKLKPQILIVEDIKSNRFLLGTLLKDYGVNPSFASDGIECIEMLESSENNFDAIFLDLRMPRMDGFEVASRIRTGKVGLDLQSIPIAVISAEVLNNGKRDTLKVDKFITKPFVFQEVKQFVDDLALVS